MGFHAAGYNDKDTNWPWFIEFLGGAVFHINSWPPLPAKLLVNDRAHAVTANVPDAYISPANEWYVWKPSPRLNPEVQVVIGGTNNSVKATLDVGNGPYAIAVDSAANKAYVTGLTDTLTVIDGKTLRATSLAVPASR